MLHIFVKLFAYCLCPQPGWLQRARAFMHVCVGCSFSALSHGTLQCFVFLETPLQRSVIILHLRGVIIFNKCSEHWKEYRHVLDEKTEFSGEDRVQHDRVLDGCCQAGVVVTLHLANRCSRPRPRPYCYSCRDCGPVFLSRLCSDLTHILGE